MTKCKNECNMVSYLEKNKLLKEEIKKKDKQIYDLQSKISYLRNGIKKYFLKEKNNG